MRNRPPRAFSAVSSQEVSMSSDGNSSLLCGKIRMCDITDSCSRHLVPERFPHRPRVVAGAFRRPALPGRLLRLDLDEGVEGTLQTPEHQVALAVVADECLELQPRALSLFF